MATVDPPNLRIDDGPPTSPEHSVVGDLSSVVVICGESADGFTHSCTVGPEEASDSVQFSIPQGEASGREWKIDVNYRVIPGRLTYGFRFEQELGPRTISLPYIYAQDKNTYTVTMPDLSPLTVNAPSLDAFPRLAFNTILNRLAGKAGPRSPNFTITEAHDGSYTFNAAGFSPVTLVRQSDGNYSGLSGYQRARFVEGQWSFAVHTQAAGTAPATGAMGSLQGGSIGDAVLDSFSAMMGQGSFPDLLTATLLLQPILNFLDGFESDLDNYGWDYVENNYSYSEVNNAYNLAKGLIAAGALSPGWDANDLLADVKVDLGSGLPYDIILDYRSADDLSNISVDKYPNILRSDVYNNYREFHYDYRREALGVGTRQFSRNSFTKYSYPTFDLRSSLGEPIAKDLPWANYGDPGIGIIGGRVVNAWQAQDNWNYTLGKHQLRSKLNWTYQRSPDTFLPSINSSGWQTLSDSSSLPPPNDPLLFTYDYFGPARKALRFERSFLADEASIGLRLPFETGTNTPPIYNALTGAASSLEGNYPGRKESPLSFRIGGTEFTPGGFVDFENIFRSVNSGTDTGGATGLVGAGVTLHDTVFATLGSSFSSAQAPLSSLRGSGALDLIVGSYNQNEIATLLDNSGNTGLLVQVPVPSAPIVSEGPIFSTTPLQVDLCSPSRRTNGDWSLYAGESELNAPTSTGAWCHSFTEPPSVSTVVGLEARNSREVVVTGVRNRLAFAAPPNSNVGTGGGIAPAPTASLNLISPNNLLAATNTAVDAIVIVLNQNIVVGVYPATLGTQQISRTPLDLDARLARQEQSGWRMQPASLGFRDPTMTLSPRALMDALANPESPQASAVGQALYSIVANGKASGEAGELQLFDPSGRILDPSLPVGTILQPVKMGSAKSVAELKPDAHIVRKPIEAYCVDYMKAPPQPGMLYRVAPPDIQAQYGDLSSALEASSELAQEGAFTPDSPADTYARDITQYGAVWAPINKWSQEQFARVFLEKLKANAAAAHIQWTPQMEQAVMNLVSGRWHDMTLVQQRAVEIAKHNQERKAGANP